MPKVHRIIYNMKLMLNALLVLWIIHAVKGENTP